MAKNKKSISKKKSIQKWIKGDKQIQNITNVPKYSLNQRGGLILS